MGKKLKFLKLEWMKRLPRAGFRAPVETEPMEICGSTHPRLGTGFSAQECGDQSIEKRSSLAQLGNPRVLVWKRDRGRGWMLQHWPSPPHSHSSASSESLPFPRDQVVASGEPLTSVRPWPGSQPWGKQRAGGVWPTLVLGSVRAL